MDVFEIFSDFYKQEKQERLSIQDFLMSCRDDSMLFASASERMVAAIGEPEVIDTSSDPRLSRIFMNRTIKRYPAFKDFFGMEDTIERIVGFFRYAAQGLEEKKQIIYLLGPVGGGKSSLAERLKALMEEHPIYVLAGRRPGEPAVRVAVDAVQSGAHGRSARGQVRSRQTAADRPDVTVGRSSGWTSSMAISRSSRWSGCSLQSCGRLPSPRPSRATKTIRTSRRWSAKSIFVNWSTSVRTTQIHIAIAVA